MCKDNYPRYRKQIEVVRDQRLPSVLINKSVQPDETTLSNLLIIIDFETALQKINQPNGFCFFLFYLFLPSLPFFNLSLMPPLLCFFVRETQFNYAYKNDLVLSFHLHYTVHF